MKQKYVSEIQAIRDENNQKFSQIKAMIHQNQSYYMLNPKDWQTRYQTGSRSITSICISSFRTRCDILGDSSFFQIDSGKMTSSIPYWKISIFNSLFMILFHF